MLVVDVVVPVVVVVVVVVDVDFVDVVDVDVVVGVVFSAAKNDFPQSFMDIPVSTAVNTLRRAVWLVTTMETVIPLPSTMERSIISWIDKP